jgi:hypothetical protein
MPNNVTNKIEFFCGNEVGWDIICKITKQRAESIEIDFNTLIPRPIYIYMGEISNKDKEDFGENTWYSWSRKNWGTKWNAYDTIIAVNDDKHSILFDTASSVPYPFIIAFAQTFNLKFTYKYFCEGHNFWGVEEWEVGRRINYIKNPIDIKKELHIELKGWDYDYKE